MQPYFPVEISTYILCKDTFTKISEYTDTVKDRDYVYGAITMHAGHQEILSMRHYDLVDQLWCYFTDALSALVSGKSPSGYFPDQPLYYAFSSLPNNKLKITIDQSNHVVPKYPFLSAMATAGIHALSHLQRINPRDAYAYAPYLETLQKLPLNSHT